MKAENIVCGWNNNNNDDDDDNDNININNNNKNSNNNNNQRLYFRSPINTQFPHIIAVIVGKTVELKCLAK